jgi:hypothetical protein
MIDLLLAGAGSEVCRGRVSNLITKNPRMLKI